jgi:aminocarboxymuconate-semialdehyde decarboxylase
VLQGGIATAAGALATPTAAPAASESQGAAGSRAIDIHAHYYPQGYFDVFNSDEAKRFESSAGITDKGFFFKTPAGSNGPLPLRFIDLKLRLADMDAQGVSVHALSLTSPMVYWADAELSHKLAKAWNDGAVAAHQAYPDRFVVLATLPMLDPDRAIDELDRVSKLPGVRGIYMGTNINNRDLDDPLFAPIFVRIEALDLPIFLHPLQTVGGMRLQPYYLNNLLGNPYDTAIAACHLIFGGVLDRHPRLKVNCRTPAGRYRS